MKLFGNLLLFMLVTGLLAGCDAEPSASTGTDTTGQDTTSTGEPSGTDTETSTRPTCDLNGTVLDENQFWAKNENLLVAVVAAPETNDPTFGESHRVLEMFDGKTCERVMREVLPVSMSPDFPYYLSDITYNNLSRLVAVRGFDKIYILDLSNRKLNGPVEPAFLNTRYAEDAQSGMIQRLEVWEDYLIGFAQSEGAFVFDLSNPEQPKAVLPSAEYEIEEGLEYHSLFLLPSSDAANGVQAILPKFNYETEEFSIGAMFQSPLKVDTNIPRNVRNNRYLVLKELVSGTESRPIAIDMEKMKMFDLPADVAKKKVTDIVDWMKKQ